VIGGMGVISKVMVCLVESVGVEIMIGVDVVLIDVCNGVVFGVIFVDGVEFWVLIVVFGIYLKIMVFDFVGVENFFIEIVEDMCCYCMCGVLVKVNMVFFELLVYEGVSDEE